MDSVKLQWSLKARTLMYADKPRQYEEVRGLMVKMNESYTTLFDPADIANIRTDADENEMERIEEERRTGSEKIKQGYKRIMTL